MPRPVILLLTRPEPASRAFQEALGPDAGPVDAVIAPLFGITCLDPPAPAVAPASLVFTSAAGVRAHVARGGRRDLPVVTVGEATAEAARQAGMPARTGGADADALVAALIADPPPQPILHLHGVHHRGRVADRLRAAGLDALGQAVYDQPPRPPSEAAARVLAGARPVVVPLFSPRSAALFAQWPISAPLLVAAMSEAVAKQAAGLHTRAMTVAARPDAAAMREATRALLDMARKLEAGEAGV